MSLLTLIAPVESNGQRIDRWLTTQLPAHSRSEIQRWIEEGRVQVENTPVKAGYRLAANQTLQIDLPDSNPPSALLPQDIPLSVLYEDESLLVINKPANLVVHPAPGHAAGTLVNAILHHVPDLEGVGGEQRPGLVHRLDKDTSGVLVVAKDDRAHRYLQEQFKDRTVYKEYLALVEGRLNPEKGRISAPVGRHPTDRKRFAVLAERNKGGNSEGKAGKQGREAVTDYETIALYRSRVAGLENLFPFSLLRIVLHTGRTHQIRVHLAWLKHPVVGDTLYGPSKPRLPLGRQFLHAHKLRIRLPLTGNEMEFVAPLPAELKDMLQTLAGTALQNLTTDMTQSLLAEQEES